MIKIKLSEQTERLRPLIKDLLLYSNLSNITVEVGPEQTCVEQPYYTLDEYGFHTQINPKVIFVDETECETLEDVMSQVALKIYDEKIHKNHMLSSEIWLMDKHGDKAPQIASVIEKAIEPDIFFGLESHRL